MEPIIATLLDTDYYKLTMGQLVFRKYAGVPVRYAFINCTAAVNVADFVPEGALRAELDHVRELRFREEELTYLAGLTADGRRVFHDDYLDFLRGLVLPPYELRRRDGRCRLEFSGPWGTAIYWEIPALAIVNELYCRARTGDPEVLALAVETGRRRLIQKISKLRPYPGIKFADFGTRRRFSRGWQEEVLAAMKQELPGQFIGTSNVDLARRLGVAPIGTFAHEMYMVMSGVRHDTEAGIRNSHHEVLRDWWEMYGAGLSTALADNYGTDFFFRDFRPDQAAAWRALRQDSGDPVAFGEKAIAFYEGLGIDPREKTVVFSDGLDVDEIIMLYRRFSGRINTAFGWGTNLTNDLGLAPLSLIIKATEANGHGTVKLSDNPAKALGRAEDVARFQRIFGHQPGEYRACRY